MLRHYSDTATYAPRQPSMLGPGRQPPAVQSGYPLAPSPGPGLSISVPPHGDMVSMSRAKGTVSLPTSPLGSGRTATAGWDDLHPQSAMQSHFAPVGSDSFWPASPTYEATSSSQHLTHPHTANDLASSDPTSSSGGPPSIGELDHDYAHLPPSAQPTTTSFSPTAPYTGYDGDVDVDFESEAQTAVVPGPRRKRAQVRIACTHCQKACKKCSNTRPCDRCVKYKLKDCVDSSRKPRKTGVKRGPYKRRVSKGEGFYQPPPPESEPLHSPSNVHSHDLVRHTRYDVPGGGHPHRHQQHPLGNQPPHPHSGHPGLPLGSSPYSMYPPHTSLQATNGPAGPHYGVSPSGGLTAGAAAAVSAETNAPTGPTHSLGPPHPHPQSSAPHPLAPAGQVVGKHPLSSGIPLPLGLSNLQSGKPPPSGHDATNDAPGSPMGAFGGSVGAPPPLAVLQGAFAGALAAGPRWINGRRINLSLSTQGGAAGTLEPTFGPPSGGAFPMTLSGRDDPFSRAVSPIHMRHEIPDYMGAGAGIAGGAGGGGSVGAGSVMSHGAVDGGATSGLDLNVNVSSNANDEGGPPYSPLSAYSAPTSAPLGSGGGGRNGSGQDFDILSPGVKALQRIRKPSLYTLMSTVSSASVSRAGSPVLQQQQQQAQQAHQQCQSPTLFDQPLDMDLDAQPSWAIDHEDGKDKGEGHDVGVNSVQSGAGFEGQHAQGMGGDAFGDTKMEVDALGMMDLEGPFHHI